jgi:hypothetical protein
MKKPVLLLACLSLLAACDVQLSQEQMDRYVTRNQQVADVTAKACIAVAVGRTPNYDAITALGYETYDTVFPIVPGGHGIVRMKRSKALVKETLKGDLAETSSKNLAWNMHFTKNVGCNIGDRFELTMFHGLGKIWKRGIENAGYKIKRFEKGTYYFDAHGVPMTFTGSSSPSYGNQFFIKREGS